MRLLCLFNILALGLGLVKVSTRSGVCIRKSFYYQNPTIDYCEEPNQPHLACNNNNGWDKEKCGRFPAIYTMTPEIIKDIVRQHNVYRNIVAEGNLPEVPIAARMLKMKWDGNLAKLAELAVKRCTLEPTSRSLSTTSASKPGFNAIFTKYPNTHKQHELEVLSSHIKAWFNQYKFVTLESLKTGRSPGGQEISHFLQLMTGLNDRVGCAVAIYYVGHWKVQSMVCLYACNKKQNKFPYRFGKVPGEGCHCGIDPQFNNLCSDEEYVEDCSKLDDDSMCIGCDRPKQTTTTTTTTTRKPTTTETTTTERYEKPTKPPKICFGFISCIVKKLMNL